MTTELTPEELRPIVNAWGGIEKLARILDVSNRLVSYWLAGKRRITEDKAELIRSLKPKSGSRKQGKGTEVL